jgi:hypothetical protein
MALSVAYTIPDEFRTEYHTNLEHEVQQVVSRFQGRGIKMETFDGKEATFGSLEPRSFQRRSGRLQQSAPTEAELHQRKMVKVPYFDQAIFDKWDDEFLGKLKLPDSETIQAQKYAYNRLIDTEVCVAASAIVYGGDDGVTAIEMPTSQQVAVDFDTYTGMSPGKLVKAMQIFEENDYDHMEKDIYLAMTPAEKRQLYSYIESGTNDTWAEMIAAWVKGTEKKLFGFTPFISNRLERAASTNIDTCFAYVANEGIYMEPGMLDVKMDVLPTQQHALQISAYATLGFMRRQEKAVVQIFCDSDTV